MKVVINCVPLKFSLPRSWNQSKQTPDNNGINNIGEYFQPFELLCGTAVGFFFGHCFPPIMLLFNLKLDYNYTSPFLLLILSFLSSLRKQGSRIRLRSYFMDPLFRGDDNLNLNPHPVDSRFRGDNNRIRCSPS